MEACASTKVATRSARTCGVPSIRTVTFSRRSTSPRPTGMATAGGLTQAEAKRSALNSRAITPFQTRSPPLKLESSLRRGLRRSCPCPAEGERHERDGGRRDERGDAPPHAGDVVVPAERSVEREATRA